jgi:hypothetical protein
MASMSDGESFIGEGDEEFDISNGKQFVGFGNACEAFGKYN